MSIFSFHFPAFFQKSAPFSTFVTSTQPACLNTITIGVTDMMRIKDLFPDASGSGRVLVLGELLLDFVPCDSDMRLSQPGTVLKPSAARPVFTPAPPQASGSTAALSGRSVPTRSASLPSRPSPHGVSGRTQSSIPIPASWDLHFSNTSPPAGIIHIIATALSAVSCVPKSCRRRPLPARRSCICRACCLS